MVRKIMLCVCFMGLVSFNALCQEDPSIAKKIDEIMDVTGTAKALKSMPEYMVATFSQVFTQRNQKVPEPMAKLLQDNFKIEDMDKSMRNYLKERFDATKAEEVLDWYRLNPLAKKVVDEESKSITAQAVRQEEEFAKAMMVNRPSAESLLLFQRLDKSLHATEDSIESGLLVHEAMLRASLLEEQKIQELLQLQRKALETEEQAQTMTSLMFRYRNFSPEEIEAYLKFLDSPAGQWVITTLSDGMKDVMKKASGNYAKGAVAYLKSLTDTEKAAIFGEPPTDDLYEVFLQELPYKITFAKNFEQKKMLMQLVKDYGQVELTTLIGKMKSMALNFSYITYPAAFIKDTGIEGVFNQTLEATMQRLGGEKISSQQETLGGYPSMIFTIKGPANLFLYGRYIFIGQTLFQFMAFTEQDYLDQNKTNIEMFLNSLRPTDSESGGEAKPSN